MRNLLRSDYVTREGPREKRSWFGQDYLQMCKEKVWQAADKVRTLFRDTSLEIAVVAAVGMAIAGGISTRYEQARTKLVPISFSEIHQLEDNATAKGDRIGELSEFYAKLWDSNSKIYESHNFSWKNATLGNNTKTFAKELETHIDPALKIHKYNLAMILDELPALGTAALKKLKDLKRAYVDISQVNSALDDAWSESHVDHYRTETYTDTETYRDSDGNSHTRTVTKTRRVYDHTTHSYRYDNQSGEAAIDNFRKFLEENPNLVWPEELARVTKTKADGEYAAESSRKKKGVPSRLSPEELVKLANEWNPSSTYSQNRTGIISSFSQTPQHAIAWAKNEPNSHSTSYNTGSHFDSGPTEFRVAEAALANGRKLEKKAGQILNGIEQVIVEAESQRALIDKFIGCALDGEGGKPSRLKSEILSRANKWQRANFSGAEDSDRFRALMVLLWTVLGGLAGAGLGYGVDKCTDVKQTWGKPERRRYY